MAENDWTPITDALSSIKRAVTAGIAPPNGGGTFVYGMASLSNTPGTNALYSALNGFAPLGKGGEISAAMKRGLSGGPTKFAPFLFLGLANTVSTDVAYMLGFSDADPSHIVLRKGALAGGLPDAPVYPAAGNMGVLAKSTATFAQNTWMQLRLEVVVNLNGDVVINCYQSDPAAHPVTSPVWSPIQGIPRFIDDTLGVNSGSMPLTSGRLGFGMQSADISRRAYFDQVVTLAQL